jgi:hypothetical protein
MARPEPPVNVDRIFEYLGERFHLAGRNGFGRSILPYEEQCDASYSRRCGLNALLPLFR